MKPNLIKVLEQCVENGLGYGFNRAHKHNDTPTRETIIDQQFQAVMNEIYEWFDFEDKHEG